MSEPADVALVVGISEYEDPTLPALPGVEQEAILIRGALADAGFITPEPLVGKHPLAAVMEYLSEASASARRVVLYWSGHGAAGPDGHWLFTADSRAAAPDERSTMSAARLAAFLDSIPGASQVVAILDSCGAGATAAQVARAVNDAPRLRPRAGRRPVAISIISATYDEADALPLVFAQSLASALRDGPPWTTWPVQLPVIAPQDLARAADGWLRENGAPEAQRVRCTGVEAGTGFFANPLYNPNARDVLLAGSAFVRRRGVMEAIYGWVDSSPGGLFLLVGSPGTGKSSVVAQLAEPAGASGPSGRGVAFVNLAGGATLRRLLEVLAPRVGAPGEAAAPEELVMTMRDSGRKVTIIIDSLDEADPVDRMQIVQRLLLPLSAIPGIHVVVAARGGATDVPGRDMGLLRQSASGWFNLDADPQAQQDIARHVTRTLIGTPSSPYRDDPKLAESVAAAVARASGGIFLIASTVAATLAWSLHAIGAADPGLQKVLRAGIGGAVESDLARFGTRRNTVLETLTPLAWIEGPGVSARIVWSRLAQALAGASERISDETIDWVIANAGFYLTATSRDGELVYRLRHQSFADYLRARDDVDPADDARSVQRRIVAALRPEPGGWPAADPYVRRYLPVHAERAGQVADLFDDPDVMVWADPGTLADVVSRVPSASRSYAVNLYLRAGPWLERLDPPLRVYVLQSLAAEESAAKDGSRPRAPLSFSVLPPCKTLWTSGPRASQHRLLKASADRLEFLVMLPAEGRWLLATAERGSGSWGTSATGSVELFDPESSAPGQRLRSLAGDGVESMVHIPAPGDDLLVCAHKNDVLEAWSLARRTSVWSRDTGRPTYHCYLLRSRGEYLMATTGAAGPAHVWHPASGDFLRSVEPTGGVTFVVWFTVDGRDRLCLGTSTGFLSFYDADTFVPLGDIEPEDAWTQAAFATVKGQPVLIGVRQDGRLEMRHAGDGRLLAVSEAESGNLVESLCVVAGISGRPVVATADGAVITLWTTTPLQRAQFLTGHAGMVTALGVLPANNGLNSLVSASADGTVRAWPPLDNPDRGFSEPPISPDYKSLRVTELNGRSVLLTEGWRRATVVDAENGTTVRSFEQQPLMSSRDPDYAVPGIRGVVARGEDAMVLTYHDGAAQRMWSLTSGKKYALPTSRFEPRMARVTTVGAHADALLVIGDGIRPVSSFDPSGALVATFADSDGAMPSSSLAGSVAQVVLLRKAGWLAAYNARTGTKLAEAVLPHPDSMLAAAAAEENGAWIVYSIPSDSTWLSHLSFGTGREGAPVRLLDGHTLSATAMTCGRQSYAAVAHADQVLLIRPADGSVALPLPFIGRVRAVVATGPDRLCVLAGGRLVHLQVDAQLNGPLHLRPVR